MVLAADVRIGGRYRLDRQLASGGMGTVLQGWDERLHRPVAVKKLHLEQWLPESEREIAISRAMREARITARLHHANAVQVFDLVIEGGTPYLIMEYVPSRSLGQVVREDGPLPPAEVARIGTQLAAALAAAHRAGIVHRDVKPGNVLIARDGSAKLTDFGISHAFGDTTVTSTGILTGTPAFLPPEVARGGASDFASDVYSLGATLYMAVEGRPPFGMEQNPMAVLHRVASGRWDPPTRSGQLTPILTRMMSANPHERPSMVDVANTMSELYPLTPQSQLTADTQQLTAPYNASKPSGTRVLPAPPNRPVTPPSNREPWRRWVAIVAAMVAVLIAAVVATVLLRWTGSSNRTANGLTSSVAPPSTASSRAHESTTPLTSTAATATPTSAAIQPGVSLTDQDLANAVIDYFTLVPGNLDAGWARLTPHFRQTRAQNRAAFNNYWNSVARVDVTDPRGELPNSATATLTYHYKDGRVVTDQTQFRFVRQDGVLKIDDER